MTSYFISIIEDKKSLKFFKHLGLTNATLNVQELMASTKVTYPCVYV